MGWAAGPPGEAAEIRLAPGVTLRNVVDPFDYFSNSWTVIGLKDYPEAARISPQGEWLLGEGNSCIIRGEQDEAVDGLYSFLLHSTSTQGFPEGVYYEKREAWGGTVPHLWAAALYVTTLRNMLVREEGRDIHLLSAVPAAWLEPGKKISFENAPTRFGVMSMTAEAGKDFVDVRFSRPARADPERLLIHLPPEFEITGVSRCGNVVKIGQLRDVFLPGRNLDDRNEIRIGVRRKPGTRRPDFAAKVAEFLAASR